MEGRQSLGNLIQFLSFVLLWMTSVFLALGISAQLVVYFSLGIVHPELALKKLSDLLEYQQRAGGHVWCLYKDAGQ